jgi:PAS domain S-box-containing protein
MPSSDPNAPDLLRLRQAVDASGEVIFMTDRDGVFTFVNPQFERLYGYAAAEVVGRATPRVLKSGITSRETYAQFWERLLQGQSIQDARVNRARDGRLVHVEIMASPIWDESRTLVGFLAIQRDVTARAVADEERHYQQTLLATERELTPDGILVVDAALRVISFNRRFASLWTVEEDIVGVHVMDLVESIRHRVRDAAPYVERVRRLYESYDEVSRDEVELIDGRVFDRYSAPMHGPDGRFYGRVTYFRDVTDRRQVERALSVSRAQLQLISDNVLDLIGQMRLDGTFLYASPSYETVLGYRPDALVGTQAFALVHPDDLPRVQGVMDEAIKHGTVGQAEFRYRRADGEYVWVELVGKLLFDAEQAPSSAVFVSRDITERKRSEEAQREYDRRLQLAVAAADMAVFAQDRDLRYTWLHNPQFGLSPDQAIGRTDLELLPHELARRITAIKSRAIETGERVREEVAGEVGGQNCVLELFVEPTRNESGLIEGIIGASLDVTAHARLEVQLRQAQRMEALGSLAGGIAHDFNNLLTAILGYCDLALAAAEPGSEVRRDLEEIQHAARSAESLTRQLLIFGRKSIVQPAVLRLNDVVGRVEKILRRVVGEHVAFDVSLSRDMGFVRADPGQLEQVVMNLVVNARDAMPMGGSLTISTGTAQLDESDVAALGGGTPGAFDSLTVTDTGGGMTPELQSQIFDPFFTTKGPEKGTGLGLATVHGIVRQAGGYVSATSVPGQGSRFTVLLPRVAGEPDAPARRPEPRTVFSGTETILFVEDNEGIRRLAERALRGCGYTVLPARDAAEALALAEDRATFDLMVTDIVMPGMSGRVLAEHMLDDRPDLRIVFTSGFTEDSQLLQGIRSGETPFLQKPYTLDSLLRAVRRVLDGPPPRR